MSLFKNALILAVLGSTTLLLPLLLPTIVLAEGSAELVQKVSLSEDRISGLAVNPVSPDLYVAAKSDGYISLNSVRSRSEIWKIRGFSALRGHEKITVIAVSAFSIDGKLIAIGRSNQAEVLVLKSSDGSVVKRLTDTTSSDPGILGAKFSLNNKLLVLSHWRSKSMSVWDLSRGLEIVRLKDAPVAGSISSATISFGFGVTTDETFIVDVNAYGTRIWDRQSGKVRKRFYAPRLDAFSNLGHISAAVVSPDAKYSVLFVMTSSREDKSPPSYALVLQNNETGKLESRSPIALAGNQFPWLQGDFKTFVMSGFIAGTFFTWNARNSEPPVTYQSTSTWLNADYGWPAGLPFQGFLFNDAKYALSIVDTGMVGLWNLKP